MVYFAKRAEVIRLKMNKFEELCDRVNKIIEIVDKVPSEMKNDVFATLFESAKECGAQNLYEEEILKLSENKQSLKEYILETKPVSNIERSLLFVYYLEVLGVQAISSKHVAACYNICELNEPGNLTQNLRDACSTRYGYLEIEQNYFHTTEKGKQFCVSES